LGKGWNLRSGSEVLHWGTDRIKKGSGESTIRLARLERVYRRKIQEKESSRERKDFE